MPESPKFRVMIVDDDPDARRMMHAALSARYEVVEAHDGLDALEKVEDYEPDLVILDMVMPLMDGIEVCEAIRRKPGFRHVQVMFLSAHTSREEINRVYEAGGNLFIPKPVEPSRLLRNVDLYFERTPPQRNQKKMTLKQIQIREQAFEKREGRHATAESSDDGLETLGAARSGNPARSAPAPAAQPAPRAPGEADAVKPRVLVVEDDKDLAQMTRMALQDAFEVFTAHDGLSAVERVSRYEPDIMIIDVMLPKMNGYQLCQSVRRTASFADIPIVFVTAKGSSRDREYALRVGGDAFLAKPFDMDDLVAICMGFTLKPDFTIRPKTFSAYQLEADDKQEGREERLRHERFERSIRREEKG